MLSESVSVTIVADREGDIYEGEYDITKVSYLDENVQSEPDEAFYYAVAWKLKAYGKNEAVLENTGLELDYWYISNVARVTPYPTIAASTPPDWHRTPSLASIFPQFAAVLRLLVAQLEAASAKLLGQAEMLEQYISFLKSEINRYEAIVV